MSASSVRQVHAVLGGALNQAVRWRWLPTNPARDAVPPPRGHTEITAPDPDAVRELMRVAEQYSPEFGMLVHLGAVLGARRGELCGLRWRDVDVDARTVTIRTGVVDVAGHLVEKDTKAHAARTISIDPGTAELLRRHRQSRDDRARAIGVELAGDAFVLSEAPDGAAPYRPDKATTAFRTVCRHAGRPGARLHDLRHFAATQLIGAGHDVRTVAGRLGHKDASRTLDIYAGFLPNRDRAAADDLGRLLTADDTASDDRPDA